MLSGSIDYELVSYEIKDVLEDLLNSPAKQYLNKVWMQYLNGFAWENNRKHFLHTLL